MLGGGFPALFTAEVNADNTLHSKDGIVEYSSDGIILLLLVFPNEMVFQETGMDDAARARKKR